MRDNNIISILDVLLTETTLVTNPGPVRIWDCYRRGPRFVRILDWSNLGPPQRHNSILTNTNCAGRPSPDNDVIVHNVHKESGQWGTQQFSDWLWKPRESVNCRLVRGCWRDGKGEGAPPSSIWHARFETTAAVVGTGVS